MPRHRSVLLSFAVLSLTACHPGFFPAREIGMGDAVQLRVGESGEIRGTGTRFRVDSILDSRCPSEVTCIQGGAAVVWYTINGGDGVWQKGAFGLRNPPAWHAVDSRYRLELLDVQPLPGRRDTSEAKIATIGVGPHLSSR